MVYTESVKIPLKDINEDLTITDKGILELFENVCSHHSDMVGFGVASRGKKRFYLDTCRLECKSNKKT